MRGVKNGVLTDLSGKIFGRLTVLSMSRRANRISCICQCLCGKVVNILKQNLIKKNGTKSCGCYAIDIRTKHSHSNSGTYYSWQAMHQRCENPRNHNYKNYGARGISVCKRWYKFENFLSDMGEKKGELKLDRIDNNGNYEPSNCRWATQREQSNNRRVTKFITIDDITMPLSYWIEKHGIIKQTFTKRLKRGLTPKQALTLPLANKRNAVLS